MLVFASFAGGGTSAVSAARKSKEVPHMHYVTLCDIIPRVLVFAGGGTSAVSAVRKSKEVPHMHYVTFPHMHSCIILADCARDSVQHGAHLHIDSHICRSAKDSA